MHYSNVCLHTFGYVLPPRIVTSEELEHRLAKVYERLKLPVGRLEMMSGIRERRFWNPGTRPSEGGILAGRQVMEQADLAPEQIECLIFTSVSRDMMEPATASFVHAGLELSENCLLFDLSNACLGFLDGMVVLANMIELGQVKNGLLVAGETAEELVESTIESLLVDMSLTRKSIKPAFASLTIGSGAVALYMCQAEGQEDRPRLVHGSWQANTAHSGLCQGSQSGSAITLMNTNSEELLQRGVETAHLTWQSFSAKPGWQAADIDRFFCHQVGSAHARLLFDSLGLEMEKNFETLAILGNVGSVSAPVTLAMAIDQKVFQPGQKGALLGIGSGINCLMLGVDWEKH
ncbi:MAG: 3-oxoacyl-ACP synthase III [Desulfobulbaceae bacterium]|nr:3-oxoacyl-ACP synthase III [Desulfobulbaceae bacterium]